MLEQAVAFDLSGKRVYVSGHRGMVGSALLRRLKDEDCEVLTTDRSLDLREQAAVSEWFCQNRPDVLIIAAAKVGGIMANDTYPADFLYDNVMIAANAIEASRRVDVQKLLFLGSSCIYPKFAQQPIKESSLMTGPLESTNEGYAIAKIAGIKLCQAYRKQYGCDYISAMPTNLYGPGDNFDLSSSHVLPALLRKAHEAKLVGSEKIEIWGTGAPKREFLYVDDLADACVFLLKNYSEHGHVNIGTGKDISIADLARVVCDVVGYKGEIVYDTSKPDGTPRKLMSADMLNTMGWRPSVGLIEGITLTYEFLLNGKDIRV